MSTRRVRIAFVGVALGGFSVLPAQTVRGPTIDAAVGLGYGGGGKYNGRVGVEGAITLVPRHRSARFIALSIGGFNSLPYHARCGGTSGDCAERYPTLTNLGVLGGVEWAQGQHGFRAQVGPAVFNGRRRTAVGGIGQLDASRRWRRITLILTARGSLFPRSSSELLRVGSAGLGVRLR